MAEPWRVLIVDDDARNIQVAANALSSADISIGFATSGADALQRLRETPFDLILLDLMMPRMDGFEVCARLKEDATTAGIPVIFLTARTDEESLEQAYEVGGVDYVSKPFRRRELVARVRSQLSQLELMRQLETLATRDSLTGVYNRRQFFLLGEQMLSSASGIPVVLMIDIDHFKRVNDTHGHHAGDRLLGAVAGLIQSSLPAEALLGRLGGEEFAVLMLCDEDAEAARCAECIRERVEGYVLTDAGAPGLSCTLSIGIGRDAHASSLDHLLKRADAMLYHAKDAGRNRVMVRER